jgi:CAAX prenyl protease-like protein
VHTPSISEEALMFSLSMFRARHPFVKVKYRLGVTALFVLVLLATASAQTPSASPDYATASSNQTAIAEYSPPPAIAAKAEGYRDALHTHFFIGTFYGFLVLLAVLYWRLGPKYRNWAERISSRRFVQVMVFAPLMLLTVSVLSLPTTLWDQMLELNFGRSVQHWASWWSDWLTNQIIYLIVGTLVVWILYAVIAAPRGVGGSISGWHRFR